MTLKFSMKLSLNQNYAIWIGSQFLKITKKMLIFHSANFLKLNNLLQNMLQKKKYLTKIKKQ